MKQFVKSFLNQFLFQQDVVIPPEKPFPLEIQPLDENNTIPTWSIIGLPDGATFNDLGNGMVTFNLRKFKRVVPEKTFQTVIPAKVGIHSTNQMDSCLRRVCSH